MLPRPFTGTGYWCPVTMTAGRSSSFSLGKRWRPVLKVDQPVATLWFHPHPHGDTARQIYMGLAGMIIVDDGSEA